MVHEKRDRVECHLCGKTFCKEAGLKKHINIVHDQVKIFNCHICNQKYSYKNYLRKHIVKVHGEGFTSQDGETLESKLDNQATTQESNQADKGNPTD